MSDLIRTCAIMAGLSCGTVSLGVLIQLAIDRRQHRQWERKVNAVFRPYEDKWGL